MSRLREKHQRNGRSRERLQTNRHQRDTFPVMLARLDSCSWQERCNNRRDETIDQASCLRWLVHAQSRTDQVRRSDHSKKMVHLVLVFALALAEFDFS